MKKKKKFLWRRLIMETTKKKPQRVFVMCGPAGAGKSTWVIQQMRPEVDLYISRDSIRFMLLKDEDDYFAKENQVKKIFYNAITDATSSDWEDIYIDATHLTTVARFQTLQNITSGIKIIAVSFEVPTEVAIERNNKRTGRSLVPESVIKNMNTRFKIPALYEGFDEIWHINAEGAITKEAIEAYE